MSSTHPEVQNVQLLPWVQWVLLLLSIQVHQRFLENRSLLGTEFIFVITL